jgi:MtN3 and saliva related transmembrane protein
MSMNFSSAESLGFIAAFFTTLAFLPQVIKVIRTRQVIGLSLLMLSLQATGNLLWIFYGIWMRLPSLLIANVITLALVVTVLIHVVLSTRVKKTI